MTNKYRIMFEGVDCGVYLLHEGHATAEEAQEFLRLYAIAHPEDMVEWCGYWVESYNPMEDF